MRFKDYKKIYRKLMIPITDEEIIHAMKKLNNRPRKRLGYKTPNQVFFGESFNVALTT